MKRYSRHWAEPASRSARNPTCWAPRSDRLPSATHERALQRWYSASLERSRNLLRQPPRQAPAPGPGTCAKIQFHSCFLRFDFPPAIPPALFPIHWTFAATASRIPTSWYFAHPRRGIDWQKRTERGRTAGNGKDFWGASTLHRSRDDSFAHGVKNQLRDALQFQLLHDVG